MRRRGDAGRHADAHLHGHVEQPVPEYPSIAAGSTVRQSSTPRCGTFWKPTRGTLLIGEDLHDPYGGAFKVTQGLSTDFPGR